MLEDIVNDITSFTELHRIRLFCAVSCCNVWLLKVRKSSRHLCKCCPLWAAFQSMILNQLVSNKILLIIDIYPCYFLCNCLVNSVFAEQKNFFDDVTKCYRQHNKSIICVKL